MIKREQVEAVLKVNGMSPTAPDEQIRSVLLSARYNQDEVDTAIMVLREDAASKKVRMDGLHKVFRTDEALMPEEISKLLGIEVDASPFYQPPVITSSNIATIQYVTIWIFSILFAVVGIMMYMYMNDVGPFHPAVVAKSEVNV